MKDLEVKRPFAALSSASPRTIIIGFLLLLLGGLILILILFAGGTSLAADETTYSDGKLKTIITYYDDTPKDVWIQHIIYREDGFLSREKIGETNSYTTQLKKGENLVEYQVSLQPGTYKIFIYVSTTDPEPKRITGFIHSVEIYS